VTGRWVVAVLVPAIACTPVPARANLIITPIFDSSITTDTHAVTSLLAKFNQSGAGTDFNDWASGIPLVRDARGIPGATPNLGAELTTLDTLGYNLVAPEPSTMLLFGTALLPGAALWKERRSS
jgi:hypothetical protein